MRNVMISRYAFVQLLNLAEKQNEFDERIGKAIDTFSYNDQDGLNNNSFVFTTPLVDSMLKVLEKDVNDQDDIISYYAYELNWGKKHKEYRVTYHDGRIFEFPNPEAVYDYIVMVNKEEAERKENA